MRENLGYGSRILINSPLDQLLSYPLLVFHSHELQGSLKDNMSKWIGNVLSSHFICLIIFQLHFFLLYSTGHEKECTFDVLVPIFYYLVVGKFDIAMTITARYHCISAFF